MLRRMMMGSLASKVVVLVMCAGMGWFGATLITEPAVAAEGVPAVAASGSAGASAQTSALGMKYLSAALAVGIGSLAAGIAVAMVGSAAMGAIAERPELMGRSLIYVGLAEGIAIYGVVVAIMILLG